jgi:hypothetical protein
MGWAASLIWAGGICVGLIGIMLYVLRKDTDQYIPPKRPSQFSVGRDVKRL